MRPAPPAPFIPSYALVTAPSAVPSRWMFVLHGILGSGSNLRSFARRLAGARPAWGFVLVDLRMHGQSQGAPPPHTLASAAEDLERLEQHLALPIAGVMGHSFGGKVALTYTARRDPARELDVVWVLDASLGTRRDRTRQSEVILQMLREVPQPLPSRERFVELVRAGGHSAMIAEWLAMNVRRADDGFRLRLDLPAIAALLDDYYATDAWPVIERGAGARMFHVVVADRANSFDEGERARLAGIAARSDRVRMHLVEGAGHWVHVDAPDALLAIVGATLGP